ncbi:MAG TPA: chemotaxis protein CheX [Candidatus Angelobacter sp.]|nr:chemotaxis protein CheX [Candidatus Angelobacter sp.]
MRMELIQPFINAADAVLAEALQSPLQIGDVTMDEEAFRPRGVASLITVKGDIEGRIIFDVDTPTAAKVASYLAGSPMPESEEVARETVCELANMVIGSAITALNDQGFRFKVSPPVVHQDAGEKSSVDQEALVMCFDTGSGNIFMNIAMRYGRRRRNDPKPG